MKRFIYKHFATFLTLLVTIGTAITVNCIPNVSVSFMDNFIFAAVIGLNLTFLFDFTRGLDSINDEIKDLTKSFPTSRIESYSSVDQVAEQLCSLVSSGKHEVDIVLFDTRIRTTDPKKVNKMVKFLKLCSEKKEIKMRLAFVPSPDSICYRIDNIIESEKKNSNSFYAYQNSSITFASFMIIDGRFVSIRTPHKNGSKSIYCVVKEQTLCALYSSWFNILWDEAIHVDKKTLVEFIDTYSAMLPNVNTLNYYKSLAEELTK